MIFEAIVCMLILAVAGTVLSIAGNVWDSGDE